MRVESAPMELNPARPSAVIGASLPPARAASQWPNLMWWKAAPMQLAEVAQAQAVACGVDGPLCRVEIGVALPLAVGGGDQPGAGGGDEDALTLMRADLDAAKQEVERAVELGRDDRFRGPRGVVLVRPVEIERRVRANRRASARLDRLVEIARGLRAGATG